MTACESPSSIVNRSRSQSQEQPINFNCSTIRLPYFCFQAHARSRKASRPRSRRVLPSFFNSRSSMTVTAMEAWSVPGIQQAL